MVNNVPIQVQVNLKPWTDDGWSLLVHLGHTNCIFFDIVYSYIIQPPQPTTDIMHVYYLLPHLLPIMPTVSVAYTFHLPTPTFHLHIQPTNWTFSHEKYIYPSFEEGWLEYWKNVLLVQMRFWRHHVLQMNGTFNRIIAMQPTWVTAIRDLF